MYQRKTRAMIKCLVIVAATFVCIAMAYFIISNAIGGRLATASNGITLSAWKAKYLNKVILTGVLSGLCSFIWFILTMLVFKVEYAVGMGKRTMWAILAFATVVISIAVPMIYSVYLGIQVNSIVIASFVFFFTIINYWLVTIFTTPVSFKYTPVGAQLFLLRAKKQP